MKHKVKNKSENRSKGTLSNIEPPGSNSSLVSAQLHLFDSVTLE